MTNIILQPCGNKLSQEHYKDTIEKSISLDDISNLITKDQYKALIRFHPDKKVKIWGITPGKTKIKQWKKITIGDVALFSKTGGVFASTVITLKMHNPKLAKALWGVDDNNQTWEYIYFLSEVKKQDILYEDLNAVIPYKSNFVFQGFSVLNAKQSNNVLDAFDSFRSDT